MWSVFLRYLGKLAGGPLSVAASWLLEEIIKRVSRAISAYVDKLKTRRTVREEVKVYETAKTPAEQERAFDDLSKL